MIMDRDGAMRFTLGGAGTVAGSEDFTILIWWIRRYWNY